MSAAHGAARLDTSFNVFQAEEIVTNRTRMICWPYWLSQSATSQKDVPVPRDKFGANRYPAGQAGIVALEAEKLVES